MKKSSRKQQEGSKWNKVSLILSSSWRFKVLKALEDHPKQPSQLNEELKMPYSHISKTLNQLKKSKLIKLLTPEKSQGRIYMITEEGKKILEKVEKIKK